MKVTMVNSKYLHPATVLQTNIAKRIQTDNAPMPRVFAEAAASTKEE